MAPPQSFSCPPPALLTVTLMTTVFPHSWLITKRQAVSVRVVISMLNILECSLCQNSHVSLIMIIMASEVS